MSSSSAILTTSSSRSTPPARRPPYLPSRSKSVNFLNATHMTAEHAQRNVLTTVVPDDAEVGGEDHPWEWLASLAGNHGVTVTPEQLKTTPYAVEFGPRLSALLESGGQQEHWPTRPFASANTNRL